MEIYDSEKEDEHHLVAYESGDVSDTYLDFRCENPPVYVEVHESNLDQAELNEMLDRNIRDFQYQPKLDGDNSYE